MFGPCPPTVVRDVVGDVRHHTPLDHATRAHQLAKFPVRWPLHVRLQALIAVLVAFEDQHPGLVLDAHRRFIGRGEWLVLECVVGSPLPGGKPLVAARRLGVDFELHDNGDGTVGHRMPLWFVPVGNECTPVSAAGSFSNSIDGRVDRLEDSVFLSWQHLRLSHQADGTTRPRTRVRSSKRRGRRESARPLRRSGARRPGVPQSPALTRSSTHGLTLFQRVERCGPRIGDRERHEHHEAEQGQLQRREKVRRGLANCTRRVRRCSPVSAPGAFKQDQCRGGSAASKTRNPPRSLLGKPAGRRQGTAGLAPRRR